MKLYNAL